MWGIEKASQRLIAKDADGSINFPTAVEIFKLVFSRSEPEQESRFQTLKFDLPNIKFKPELSFPTLSISTTGSNSTSLQIKLHNADVFLDQMPEGDQIVHNDIWYPLEVESFDEVRERLSECAIKVGEPIDAEKAAWLIWKSGLSVEVTAEPETFRASLLATTNSDFRETTLTATLYPYQQSGATFIELMMDHGRGVLLADEMGLGKTIQAIYAITNNVAKGRLKNLVVVPASNLANWMREFTKFSPDLEVSVHSGPRRAGTLRSLRFGDVLLSTYDIVFRDQAFLSGVVWDVVILDEAQNIKNSSAKRSEAVISLPKNSSVAITGTPIENSLSDIWSIFRFLEPELLGDEYAFNSRFPDTHASAVELSKQISPFVIRRRVSEVGDDLPERSDYFVPIFLSEEMNLRYEEVRNDPNLHQLPKMQALRQIAAVPSEYTYSSNKVSRLVDLLEEAFSNKDKAIVFASFTDTIDSLVRVIQTKFPNAYVETLDGRKNPQARQEIIDKFDEIVGASVLIANPRAAGVGLNIQAANYVFHFNPEWNPALIAQASARAYRRGQKKSVFVYYLYYRGTVEEYVLKKVEEKQTLQDAGLQELSEEPTQSQLLEALRISPTDLEEIQK